jgi:hypothetical protein
MGGENWEVRLYRNHELKKFVDESFDEAGREVAWKVVAFIKDRWPETVPILRGEEI